MAEYSIRDMITKVNSGQIRIPVFQRGFVWEPDAVAFLMDSIYKGYPIGSLLFWRTKEVLKTERQLGPFGLFKRDPDYPIDYVLDGQQRITSIFGVFQTDIAPTGDDSAFKIYFDYTADRDAQETQFLALKDEEVDSARHFPLKTLFDTVNYRRQTERFEDSLAKKIDQLQEIFKESRVPIQIIETEDKPKVAIVFERINRKGIPLDIFQLLSAWTWSDEFDLKSKFEELTEELEPFGFEGVGEDIGLLLRCAAGILNQNASAESLVSLNGSVVRDRFQEIINGITGAIDFLRNNLGIQKLSNLPYDTTLVPLSAFFAIPGNQQFKYNGTQRDRILKWFWRSCFSRRYSAGVLRNLNRDIIEILKLREQGESVLEEFAVEIKSDFFIENSFRLDSVNTKTFILLLAQQNPRSFITGAPVNLSNVLKDYNKNEFHHLYPRAFLKTQGQITYKVDSLANFCFMSKSDNNQLGEESPSRYKNKIKKIDLVLPSALCPQKSLFGDKYDDFIVERSGILGGEVAKLVK